MKSDNYKEPSIIKEHLALKYLDEKIEKLAGINFEEKESTISQLKIKILEIGEICKLTKNHRGKDSFRKLRDFRNDIAHDIGVGDIPFNRIFEMATYIKDEFSKTINVLSGKINRPQNQSHFEKYGKVGESKSDREEIVDQIDLALHEKKLEDAPKNKDFQPYEPIVEELSKKNDLLNICKEENVREEILTEVLDHINKTQTKRFSCQSPCELEKGHLNKFRLGDFEKCENPEKWVKQLTKSQKKFKIDSLPLEFIESEMVRIFKRKKNREKELQKLKNYISTIWEQHIFQKELHFELSLIESERKAFLENLYKKVKAYQKVKAMLGSFVNEMELGRLWNMSPGLWQKTGFNHLVSYAEKLEQNKSIQELAELLGKFRSKKKEYEELLIKELNYQNDYKYENFGAEELIGISEGAQIGNTLPQEFSLLCHPSTEDLFYTKYHRKKLMNWEYVSLQPITQKITNESKVKREKPDSKGPIIICVDTSGSMHGAPESIAKTVCFALLKIALKENRNCFLISFSTKIETIELTNLENSIGELIEFLSMSFNGGTDLNPALEKALDMIQTEKYTHADILMISDFVVDGISKEIKDNINLAQERDCKFKSLVIGDSQNEQVIESFDENWFYQIDGVDPMLQLVKMVR